MRRPPRTRSREIPQRATLGRVVVTATRIPTPDTLATQPVTVLSGDDLRRRGVLDVSDALREVPGVAVVQSGSFGAVTSLFMRGGESRYTKVLIDGVPVNDVGGTFYFQYLTLDNVDRIEVLEGPSSALYGADAMSGVIQIFTKRGDGATSVDASARAGSYGGRDMSLALRGGSSAIGFSLGGGWHQSDGIAAFNNRFRDGTLSGALTLRPDDRTTASLTTRYTSGDYHFPTDFAGNPVDSNSYSRERRLAIGLEAARKLADWATVKVVGADDEAHDLSEDTQPTAGAELVKSSSPSDGHRRSIDGRIELSNSTALVLTAGAQLQDESARTWSVSRTYVTSPSSATPVVTPGSDDDRTTRGYYVAAQGAPLSRFAYDASIRRDTHSDYRDVTTYHTGVSIGVWQGARVRAAYGTGFNAPAFYETQGSAFNAPNPDLQPEQTHDLDVGIRAATFRRSCSPRLRWLRSTLQSVDSVRRWSDGRPTQLHAAHSIAVRKSHSGPLRRGTRRPRLRH